MYERLKKEMETQHIRAYSLAKKADINASDLYSALRGDRRMFPGWRKRVSLVLDVPENVLFTESEVNNE